MIPYIPQPAAHLGPFTVRAFGVLAAVAVVAGCWSVVRRGHRAGIPVDTMLRFWLWMYVAAIGGAVVWSVVPVLGNPRGIFRAGVAIGAIGAIGGGLVGAVLWCRKHRLSWPETLRMLDIAACSVPCAWMFGRLGCALAHDHRGRPSTSWLAVQFPGGPRYDLGLIEFLFLAGLTLLFRLIDRRPRPAGFFLGLLGVLYGGFRIGLDTFRAVDTAPWGSVAILVGGLVSWILMLALGGGSRPADVWLDARSETREE